MRGLNLSSMFFFSGRPVYGGFVRGNRPKVKNQRPMVKAVDREAEKSKTNGQGERTKARSEMSKKQEPEEELEETALNGQCPMHGAK